MIDITAYLNPTLAIILWTIGLCIKHCKFLKKVANNYIPAILVVFGIAINLLMSGVTVDAVVSGVVTAMACVGTHKSGTEVFGKKGIDVSRLFLAIFSKSSIDESEICLDDESDDEPV